MTWQDWVDDLRKLAKHDGAQTSRWGLMFPGTYDYLGWITSGFAMSNGGEYYNPGYGGEVYYNTPVSYTHLIRPSMVSLRGLALSPASGNHIATVWSRAHATGRACRLGRRQPHIRRHPPT